MYDKRERHKAIDLFMKSATGDDYLTNISRAFPHSSLLSQAIDDAGTFFHDEIPAVE
jgi:hypothetical protein